MIVRQAVFLVGDKAARPGALTTAGPKPLLEVAPGVRFLDVVLEEAARHGFTDLVLLAGHLGEQVEAAYQGKRIREATVEVIREPGLQGAGGALRVAAERLAPWFLMGHGDSLFEINLRALTMSPGESFDARLALRRAPDPARYGAVDVEGARIVRFVEKRADLPGPALTNGGLSLMRRDAVLARVAGPCSLEQDVFPRLAEAGRLEGRLFDGNFLDMGLPDAYARAQAETPARRIRPAAFLDRDGTINIDRGYTYKPEDLAFVDGAPEAIRALNEAGYYVFVVTNQAGVARGYYGERDVQAFHAAMADQLAAFGAHVDGWYYCPHHADAVVAGYRHPDHPDRKPNPGMLLRAMAEWPVDPAGSFMIGDQDSDVAAGRAAGVAAFRFDGGNLASLVSAAIASRRS